VKTGASNNFRVYVLLTGIERFAGMLKFLSAALRLLSAIQRVNVRSRACCIGRVGKRRTELSVVVSAGEKAMDSADFRIRKS
jgi:hypothetical protein